MEVGMGDTTGGGVEGQGGTTMSTAIISSDIAPRVVHKVEILAEEMHRTQQASMGLLQTLATLVEQRQNRKARGHSLPTRSSLPTSNLDEPINIPLRNVNETPGAVQANTPVPKYASTLDELTFKSHPLQQVDSGHIEAVPRNHFSREIGAKDKAARELDEDLRTGQDHQSEMLHKRTSTPPPVSQEFDGVYQPNLATLLPKNFASEIVDRSPKVRSTSIEIFPSYQRRQSVRRRLDDSESIGNINYAPPMNRATPYEDRGAKSVSSPREMTSSPTISGVSDYFFRLSPQTKEMGMEERVHQGKMISSSGRRASGIADIDIAVGGQVKYGSSSSKKATSSSDFGASSPADSTMSNYFFNTSVSESKSPELSSREVDDKSTVCTVQLDLGTKDIKSLMDENDRLLQDAKRKTKSSGLRPRSQSRRSSNVETLLKNLASGHTESNFSLKPMVGNSPDANTKVGSFDEDNHPEGVEINGERTDTVSSDDKLKDSKASSAEHINVARPRENTVRDTTDSVGDTHCGLKRGRSPSMQVRPMSCSVDRPKTLQRAEKGSFHSAPEDFLKPESSAAAVSSPPSTMDGNIRNSETPSVRFQDSNASIPNMEDRDKLNAGPNLGMQQEERNSIITAPSENGKSVDSRVRSVSMPLPAQNEASSLCTSEDRQILKNMQRRRNSNPFINLMEYSSPKTDSPALAQTLAADASEELAAFSVKATSTQKKSLRDSPSVSVDASAPLVDTENTCTSSLHIWEDRKVIVPEPRRRSSNPFITPLVFSPSSTSDQLDSQVRGEGIVSVSPQSEVIGSEVQQMDSQPNKGEPNRNHQTIAKPSPAMSEVVESLQLCKPEEESPASSASPKLIPSDTGTDEQITPEFQAMTLQSSPVNAGRGLSQSVIHSPSMNDTNAFPDGELERETDVSGVSTKVASAETHNDAGAKRPVVVIADTNLQSGIKSTTEEQSSPLESSSSPWPSNIYPKELGQPASGTIEKRHVIETQHSVTSSPHYAVEPREHSTTIVQAESLKALQQYETSSPTITNSLLNISETTTNRPSMESDREREEKDNILSTIKFLERELSKVPQDRPENSQGGSPTRDVLLLKDESQMNVASKPTTEYTTGVEYLEESPSNNNKVILKDVRATDDDTFHKNKGAPALMMKEEKESLTSESPVPSLSVFSGFGSIIQGFQDSAEVNSSEVLTRWGLGAGSIMRLDDNLKNLEESILHHVDEVSEEVIGLAKTKIFGTNVREGEEISSSPLEQAANNLSEKSRGKADSLPRLNTEESLIVHSFLEGSQSPQYAKGSKPKPGDVSTVEGNVRLQREAGSNGKILKEIQPNSHGVDVGIDEVDTETVELAEIVADLETFKNEAETAFSIFRGRGSILAELQDENAELSVQLEIAREEVKLLRSP